MPKIKLLWVTKMGEGPEVTITPFLQFRTRVFFQLHSWHHENTKGHFLGIPEKERYALESYRCPLLLKSEGIKDILIYTEGSQRGVRSAPQKVQILPLVGRTLGSWGNCLGSSTPSSSPLRGTKQPPNFVREGCLASHGNGYCLFYTRPSVTSNHF